MASAVHFKDFGKVATDLLNDDFEYNRRLKLKTKTSEGVEFTTEGAMTGDGSNKSILAKISGAKKFANGVNLKKVQATTHGRFIGEVEAADIVASGVKLIFKAEDGAAKNSANKRYSASGKIGLDYLSGPIAVSNEFDVVNSKLNTSGAYAYENFLLGFGGAFDTDKFTVSDYNLGVGYRGNGFNLTLGTKSSLNVVNVSYDHQIASDLHGAGSLSHNITKQTQVLTLGAKYAADSQTTLKGKVDSEGILSLAFISKLSKISTLTLSSEIDMKNLEGDAHKFGLGLTIG